MNRKVFRYPLAITDDQSISLPEGAQLLAVQRREGGERVLAGMGSHEPVDLWAMVDPDAPVTERRIKIAGTGHPLENAEELSFVGSVQLLSGHLVFHVFEVKEPPAPPAESTARPVD